MAEAGLLLERDQFNCSICLDVLREPATIPCGHSYCSQCIANYWDVDEFLGVFVCPQCRQSFQTRPQLAKNTMLADLVDRLKKTGLQDPGDGAASATSPPSLAGPGDVECDVCAGSKHRAVRSCLVCLASYCDLHLQPHYDSPAFKKHKLVSASRKLQESICPQHDKLLEVYCRTDRRCVCYLCLTDEHRGHDTVLAEVEAQNMQAQLHEIKVKCELQIQQRDNDVQELKKAIMSFTRSARTAVEESDNIFTEMIRSIEVKRFELRALIRAQETMCVSQAEELLKRTQGEIEELKKNMAELQKLSHHDDNIHFLHSVQTFNDPPALAAIPSFTSDPILTFGPLMTAISDFKCLFDEVCQGGFGNIYDKVKNIMIVDPLNSGVAPDTTQKSDTTSGAVQMETPPTIQAPWFYQNSSNPFNPFPGPSSADLTFGGFNFSPLGSKPTLGSRSSHFQKRIARRKR